MGFPTIPWFTSKQKLKEVFDMQGTDTEFQLHGGGSFTIKSIRGHKRDEDITDGTQQKQFKIRILADDWDTNHVARPPGKGDQLVMWGRRHAIEASHLLAVADEKLMYVITMKG